MNQSKRKGTCQQQEKTTLNSITCIIMCIIRDQSTEHVRDHLISSYAISRRNYFVRDVYIRLCFRTVGGWFRAPFVWKIVWITSIWKLRLKSQNMPFIYKGLVGI